MRSLPNAKVCRHFFTAALAGAVPTACVGGSASLGDAGPKNCIAGQTQTCMGAGACVGGQACKADGLGYEACVCGSAPAGMVAIPGHKFPDGGVIAAFYIDKTEVTVLAYAACVTASKCTPASNDAGTSCNAGVAGRDNHPVNCVDWTQATVYCGWVGKRLPTDEEWQYAADAAEGRLYPWGNASPDTQLCWNGLGNTLGQGSRMSTCAVGSFPTGDSPFGLSDMSGNVFEWTSSGNDLRGGGWNITQPLTVRVALRYPVSSSARDFSTGLRCVR